MDKLGRQSVYIKDRELVAALKHLAADTDATLMELVETALRHLIAMAVMAPGEDHQSNLHHLRTVLETAQDLAFAYHTAAGQRTKHPIGTTL